MGFEQLAHLPFSSFMDMVRIIPPMVKLQSYRSVYSLVSSYFKDPRMRTIMSFHPLLIGGNPFSVTSIYALISFLERQWGVHSTMGGTGAIVTGLVGLIEGQGSGIRCGAEVARDPGHQPHRPRGAPGRMGRRSPADIVVSNADPAWTYKNLMPVGQTPPLAGLADQAVPVFQRALRLVLRHPPAVPGRAPPHDPDGAALPGTAGRHLQAQGPGEGLQPLPAPPHGHGPVRRPPGCDTFYALAPVPHLDSGTDWKTQAEPYRQAICAYLEQSLLPGLSTIWPPPW